MRIRYSRMRNQASAEQQVARRWNVVSGFVPEIRQLQKRRVQQEYDNEDDREHQGRVQAGSHGEVILSAEGLAGGIAPMTAARRSVHRPLRRHARIQFDLAKGAFVPGYILLQEAEQRLGLLRAQIDSLKVTDVDLGLCLLLQRAEDQEKIPYVDAHLHAVGIILAIASVIR